MANHYIITIQRSDEEATTTFSTDSENSILALVAKEVQTVKNQQAKFDGIQLLSYISVDKYELTEEETEAYKAIVGTLTDEEEHKGYFYSQFKCNDFVYVDGENFRIVVR